MTAQSILFQINQITTLSVIRSAILNIILNVILNINPNDIKTKWYRSNGFVITILENSVLQVKRLKAIMLWYFTYTLNLNLNYTLMWSFTPITVWKMIERSQLTLKLNASQMSRTPSEVIGKLIRLHQSIIPTNILSVILSIILGIMNVNLRVILSVLVQRWSKGEGRDF